MLVKGTEIRRDANTFYRDVSLWIPYAHPVAQKVKQKTTLLIPSVGGPGFTYYNLWKDGGTHLIAPRNFPLQHELDKVPGATDITIQEYEGIFREVDFRDNITLDYLGTTHQVPAAKKWIETPSGILNLACGKGKTVIALKAIARRRVPALVIVHTTSLLKQWQGQISKFLPSASQGLIQGAPSRWSWRGKDIVVAMLQTLVSHKYYLTPELRGYFGTIVWDEVHHLGADTFSQTADLFIGNRYGLSATIERADGMDDIYNYHLGKVFYTDLSQDLVPRVVIIPSRIRLNLNDPEIRFQMTDKTGQWNIPKTRNFVANLSERIRWEIELYRFLRKHRRTTLVLSHSVAHLNRLADLLDSSGLCTGAVTDLDLRSQALLGNDIVFATTQLAREGLDRPDFDTLVLSTPFGSGVAGANNFQQAVGRILRPLPDKDPLVIILDDLYIPPLHRMVDGIIRMVKSWPKHLGGPLDYTYLTNYQSLRF